MPSEGGRGFDVRVKACVDIKTGRLFMRRCTAARKPFNVRDIAVIRPLLLQGSHTFFSFLSVHSSLLTP